MSNQSTITTLESAANQIFAAVAPHSVRLVRVGVVISDEAETAATDGRGIWRLDTAALHFDGRLSECD